MICVISLYALFSTLFINISNAQLLYSAAGTAPENGPNFPLYNSYVPSYAGFAPPEYTFASYSLGGFKFQGDQNAGGPPGGGRGGPPPGGAEGFGGGGPGGAGGAGFGGPSGAGGAGFGGPALGREGFSQAGRIGAGDQNGGGIPNNGGGRYGR